MAINPSIKRDFELVLEEMNYPDKQDQIVAAILVLADRVNEVAQAINHLEMNR